VVREFAPVDSPLSHGSYLHGAGKGFVSVGRKTRDRPPLNWHQRSYPFDELSEVLPGYRGADDAYISLNRFYGSRSVSNLAQLSSLYADVDFYNRPALTAMHPRGVLEEVLATLERERIPVPSLAVATGRGLSLVWAHGPVPRQALPRWNACQRRLHDALKVLGADPMAKDAARVFRIVGTRNSKTGAPVEALWTKPGGPWDFDDLADEILPHTREELAELRARRRAQRGAKKEGRRGRRGAQNGLTITSLHEARLEDLQRLLRLRGMEKLPPGKRDAWMFAAAASLSHLVKPQLLERELLVLGKETAGWGEGEITACMQAVISRALSAGEGGTVEWSGRLRDPRYRLKNQTIIESLEITADEEESMKTIISSDTKRRRGRERKERERRDRAAKPRAEYLVDRSEARGRHRTSALALRGEGLSLREIGRKLGISHTQARRLLADA